MESCNGKIATASSDGDGIRNKLDAMRSKLMFLG